MRHWRFQSRVIIGAYLLLFAVTAGCSHKQPSAPGQYLYATIPETGQIVVYPLTGRGAGPLLATIKENPPDKPIDVSVDLNGEVFVANENGNVRAYAGRDFHYQLIHTLEG